MSISRTLHVHLGTHKTGSTSIQLELRGAVERLAASGIRLPSAGWEPGQGHHHLAWEIWGDRRFEPVKGGFATLDEEFRRDGDDAVVSCESFTARPRDPRIFEALTAVADSNQMTMRALAYVRPQWHYLDSLYVQQVKMGYHAQTFETFLEAQIDNPRFDFVAVLSPWWTLGTDLSVRPFEKEVAGDVVADFFEWLGVASPAPERSERTNARVGVRTLEAIRHTTAVLKEAGADRWEVERVAQRLFPRLEAEFAGDVRFSGLGPATARRIASHFSSTNEELARRTDAPTPRFFTDDPDDEDLSVSSLTWDEFSREDRDRVGRAVAEIAGAHVH